MKHLLALGSIAATMFLVSCDKDDNDDNLNAQDQTFVNEITLSNRSEISLANLALARATDASVRNYAQMMITEHTAAENDLKARAAEIGLNMPADSLNAMAASLRPVLQGLSGRRFDSAYIVTQIPAHEMARTIAQNELDKGANPELREYASMMLPKIQTHLVMADTIAARLR